jgi:8-oxo-dGTP pyrophosphatase MutT (NUDIX family)
MIARQCAGGVVFYANKVLIVKNDRGEWTLPKGKIHQDELTYSSAILRVKEEAGIDASILETAGNTMYEFFSRSRQQEVCNAITWYIMETDNADYILKDEFTDGGFYRNFEDLVNFKDNYGNEVLGKIIKIEEPTYTKVYELKEVTMPEIEEMKRLTDELCKTCDEFIKKIKEK